MSITPRSDRSLDHSSAWTSAPAQRHASLFIEAVRPVLAVGLPRGQLLWVGGSKRSAAGNFRFVGAPRQGGGGTTEPFRRLGSTAHAVRASCAPFLVALPINKQHGDERGEDHSGENIGAFDERQPQIDPGLQRCLPAHK